MILGLRFGDGGGEYRKVGASRLAACFVFLRISDMALTTFLIVFDSYLLESYNVAVNLAL